MKRLFFVVLMVMLCVFPVAAAKSIVVTSPTAGVIWQVNTHHTVSWTYSDLADSTKVKLILFQNGVKIDNIVQNLAIGLGGHGTYDWTAGQHASGMAGGGTGYTIRVKAEGSPTEGESGAFVLSIAPQFNPTPPPGKFSMVPKSSIPCLIITKPAAGDTVDPYNTVYVEWKKAGNLDPRVSVSLLHNGSLVATLSSSAPNAGGYTWDPKIQNPDPGSYTIQVKTLDGACEGTSGAFTMIEQGGIQLLSPQGGESWENNSSHDVIWKRLGNVQTVTILLIKNKITYMTLAQNVDAKHPAKSCTFVKSTDDLTEGDACYQVVLNNSAGSASSQSGCFSLKWPGNPDLAVTKLTYTPKAVTPGTQLTFTIYIKNIGTAPSYACQGDLRFNDVVQKTFSVPPINPSETITISLEWTIPSAGHVEVRVDTGNVNADPDKSNNSWGFIF
jgi:hypothetical protein